MTGLGNSKNHLYRINETKAFRILVFFANLITAVFWKPVFYLYSGLRVYGKQHLKNTPKGILIANHCMNLDAYYIGATTWPRTTWYAVEANNVLRKDVGWLHRINGAFGIYDGYPMAIASSVKQAMTRNEYVTIFPEGQMTYRGQTLLPFNKGAFYLALENEVPIIPLAVVLYGNKIVRHSPWFPAKVHIHILPPIPTKGLVKPGESIKKKSAELADQIYDLIQGTIDEKGGDKDIEIERLKMFT